MFVSDLRSGSGLANANRAPGPNAPLSAVLVAADMKDTMGEGDPSHFGDSGIVQLIGKRPFPAIEQSSSRIASRLDLLVAVIGTSF